jgi:hypothetical protein
MAADATLIMKTAKEHIREILEQLPDDASLEEIEQRIQDRLASGCGASEQAKLGEAGRRLAGRVWLSEDFSDWERRDEPA